MDAAISASSQVHALDLKETTMTRRFTILAAVTALAVSAGAGSAGASIQLLPNLENTTVSNHATTAKSNGIIMRDGGVCDPIRHMGC
jgi:hypothetical protein